MLQIIWTIFVTWKYLAQMKNSIFPKLDFSKTCFPKFHQKQDI